MGNDLATKVLLNKLKGSVSEQYSVYRCLLSSGRSSIAVSLGCLSYECGYRGLDSGRAYEY